MSEIKLISPLLDGFAMGNPMSSHDGVICCPAMKENSDQKYIVKIISIPASPRQLDALLLTGAYKDPAAAMDYFRELADGVTDEAVFLQQLSKMEGYLPYEGWQVTPMENGRLGYQVYLLSTYKRTLERHMRKSLMTHLGAVNLGLDLCTALTTCRRAGRMYVDLKPGNIFISDDKVFRIGDLGFVPLDSLKYASLPTKYRSAYTAPELKDSMATLNTTADIYALGMVLYQVYNNGQLPREDLSNAENFPAPANADYEMAEIIQKALAPDPKDRWQEPADMGQALVAYMQRNSVNDTPIAPPSVSIGEPLSESAPETAAAPEGPAEPVQPESSELAFLQEMVSDETAPGEADAASLPAAALSEEMTSMLAQADDLIAHEAPAPVVAPDPAAAAVATPPTPVPEAKDEDDEDEDDEESGGFLSSLLGRKSDKDVEDDEDFNEDDEPEAEESEAASSPRKHKKGRTVLITLILLLLLALLAGGGYYFYQNYYLLTIDGLEVQPFENQVTVLVDTKADESLLRVVYTDTYGNTLTKPVAKR